MFLATLIFALFGLLSPANRGSLGTAFILLFVFMGSFAGYSSSRLYKMFRGTDWKMNTLLTAFLYPGVVFLVFFLLNLVLWAKGSSGALSFGTFFTLFFLWFCVSVPLVFLGSFFGYKRETVTFPVRTNQIPRSIPVQAWYMHPTITCLIGGVLPFGAVSVELYFIMSALWLHQIYYIFGFIFLVMIVLVTTCAEISILLCYFQLCNEDYRWWWRSFMSSGMYCTYVLHRVLVYCVMACCAVLYSTLLHCTCCRDCHSSFRFPPSLSCPSQFLVPYLSSSLHFLHLSHSYCPYLS
jgi:transmembrane 9 superfamily member 2/4